MPDASAPRQNAIRSARRPAARPRPARRRTPRGVRPEPRFGAVRDRAHDLRGARLPGRRLQPVPPGVGRLHRQHGPRQRGHVRDAARRDLRLVGLGPPAGGPLRSAAGPTSSRTARSTGPIPSSGPATCPTEPTAAGADAWVPGDELFVPCRHSDGHLLGIVSVGEPISGVRPSDDQLDLLVAMVSLTARALQGAQEAVEAARHRIALEQLLQVSSRLLRAPLDRPGAPGGVRRRLRRAGLPEGDDRARRPRDRPADAARRRRLGRAWGRLRTGASRSTRSVRCWTPPSRSRAASWSRRRPRSRARRSAAPSPRP